MGARPAGMLVNLRLGARSQTLATCLTLSMLLGGAIVPVAAKSVDSCSGTSEACGGLQSTGIVQRPIALEVFGPSTLWYTDPLVVDLPVDLMLENVPQVKAILVMDDQTGRTIASGVSDRNGTLVLPDVAFDTVGTVTVASKDGTWSRTLNIGPYGSGIYTAVSQPSLPKNPIPLPSTVSPPSVEPRQSTSSYAQVEILNCEQDANFGHWHAVFCWYKITNDADARNRYYITTSKWFGTGTTSSNPWHLKTKVWHEAVGASVDGNTFMADYEPTYVNANSYTESFTVGIEPSATISWSQHDPADIRSAENGFISGNYDYDQYIGTATFQNHGYTGGLQYGATGVVPTGHMGYMFIRMKHWSCSYSWTCYDTYVDDTGWYGWTIDWS